eukprot:TRINITY_DN7586_c0_g1_i3.p1 TRINITY_DN7586_c0_g1~~TRINITY_DN7586_c0_g1_i3.p1  ORF type:complete len:377 (+),score=90.90 TRINITY_DN7586_c0_g1_i3:101-1231(+)
MSQDPHSSSVHTDDHTSQAMHQAAHMHHHDSYHQHQPNYVPQPVSQDGPPHYVPGSDAAHTLSSGFELSQQNYLSAPKIVQFPPPDMGHAPNGEVMHGVVSSSSVGGVPASVASANDMIVHPHTYPASPDQTGSLGNMIVDPTKKRKLTEFQEEKRHKCDALMAFFRVYIKPDQQSMILKDAIYNLYCKKIPQRWRLARNALYRHMWSSFKDDKISAFQSNYREYIKGIKLVSAGDQIAMDPPDKDTDLLRSVGVNDLWDFREEDLLSRNSANDDPPASSSSMMGMGHSNGGAPARMVPDDRLVHQGQVGVALVGHGMPHPVDPDQGEVVLEDVIAHVNVLEANILNILHVVQDLKAKLDKRIKVEPNGGPGDHTQ